MKTLIVGGIDMTIPKSHPRYLSLTTRDKLVEGWDNGLVATQGLIAHGRGEAFDYLIGEITTDEARDAIRAAAATLILAEDPVISVNGNVGALSAEDIHILTSRLKCKVEVNIFHRTEGRISSLIAHLERHGIEDVLGAEPDSKLPGLDHARALCEKDGIYSADVILVPLEDGDRCKALKDMGKQVITIDLNPLSRTSMTADITIVDNLVRAIGALGDEILRMKDHSKNELIQIVDCFDNSENLKRTLHRISTRF